MAFTVPRFQESGETEIIESLLAVVHRDMKLALDYYFWTAPDRLIENLPDFAVMTDGELDTFSYPFLVVGVERMTSKEVESGEWLNQVLRIGAGLVVNGATVKIVKAKARKYVRAFKAVVRSASAADLLPPSSQILDCVIDIDHQYLRHATKGTDVTQPVEFDIQITFGET